MPELTEDQRQVLAEVEADLNRMLGATTEPARWRRFRCRRGPMFGWYVKAPTNGPRAGMYRSFVYAPVGKGSRSGRATRWELVHESESWHALRKDAKARALRMYREHCAGNPAPWRS